MFEAQRMGGRLWAGVAALAIMGMLAAVVASPADSVTRGPVGLNVQAQAAAGSAAPNNSSPADILVIVTDRVTGAPTTDLAKSNFTIISHFSHPGPSCGFSNNVVSFNNVGTGAYQLQVAPAGCTWAAGDFLLQVIVSAGSLQGQTAAKFTLHTRW